MSSKGGKGHKKKNKDAIQFILANRELNDPNINNPNATDKILLQVNKDEELTKEQKKIIEAIPKIHRGVYDEEEKIKRAQTVKDLRDSIKYQKNKRFLGQRIGAIVESKDNLGRYYGRDLFHHSVYFTSDIPLAINDKVIVLVKEVSCQGLIGNVYSI